MTEQEAIRTLKGALLQGNEDVAVEALRFLSARRFVRPDGSEDVEELAFYLGGILIRIIHVSGGTIREAAGTDPASLFPMWGVSDKINCLAIFENVVRRLASSASADGRNGKKATVRGILVYLDNELTNPNLSLRMVADHFGMHPSYLSRMFKQEQGMAFSRCLQSKRLERARAMLREGASVLETAARLGYSDRNHFCRLFRRYWGTPPRTLRHR
ncbi:helix-turn-helix transcriptional regulator [Paenibacillus thalictri]|uniref:AraC family transcriptional regulator n=1 Tax=Paenibacillus thalictri TaxID=2527873 RepID=A0A4Q9DJW2_9BACL|nr:helix-turn-helix transcriptional regulator [Paenibacillus thalictri]TBL73331.1 AraC family transcriptional regulator [Paenibacillus thalictri]